MSFGTRLEHLKRFYRALDSLEQIVGGMRRLSACSGHMVWPERGMYFFTESGEMRAETGEGPRIVRVGTHALKIGATSTLWGRLRAHRGDSSGGGRHRTSIFRGHVGSALITREGIACPTWPIRRRNLAGRDTSAEGPVEHAVSKVIGDMRFLWLEIDDSPGPESLRGYVERNAIALLSNFHPTPLDPPSSSWLGRHCDRGKVRPSGLWNTNHVDDPYDPRFLGTLERLIDGMAVHAP